MSDAWALVRRLQAARRDPTWAVLEGYHAVKHAARFGARFEVVVIAEDVSAAQLPPELRGTEVVRVSRGALEEALPRLPPVAVVALAPRPEVDAAALFAPSRAPLVALDHPVHHGNVGAAVRVAAAAGAAGVVAVGGADPWSPAALRGGAGLQFAVPAGRVESLPATSRPVIALDPDEGADLRDQPLPADGVLVLGTERAGLSAATRDRADRLVRIPMRPAVSSLNLATAVAVALYAGEYAGWRAGGASTG